MPLLLPDLIYAQGFPLAGIDIVLGIVLAYGLIRGFMKGFIVEVASLIALIVGVYGAIHFSYFTVDLLDRYVNWEARYLNLTALVLTFILIVLAISLLAKLFTKLAKLMALNLLNRLLGAVFGFLKMAFVLSLLLMVFQSFNTDYHLMDKSTTEKSLLYLPLENFGEKIWPSVLEEINAHKAWPFSFEDDESQL